MGYSRPHKHVKTLLTKTLPKVPQSTHTPVFYLIFPFLRIEGVQYGTSGMERVDAGSLSSRDPTGGF